MFNMLYFDVQPSRSGLTSYLLIFLTDPLFMTPLGLQKHSIAIVRDSLQKIYYNNGTFWVACGGGGMEIRTVAVSTRADRL